MFFKTFLSFITATCLMFNNNSDAAVDIDFFSNTECNVVCNGELKTFNGSKESLDEVNNLISNYFTIDSINYDTELNTINFKCSPLNKNTNCVLILTETQPRPTGGEQLIPDLTFDGGKNTFNNLIIFGFHYIHFYNIDSKVCYANCDRQLVNSYIRTGDGVISIK